MSWFRDLFRRKQTPLYIQMENTECGAACLKIILAYYGKYVSIDELRNLCGVSRDGCTAYGVASACDNLGMDCDGYSYTLEELKKESLPCIVYWGFDHFVVLERIRGTKYDINDPAVGHITLDESVFKRFYTGVILQLKPNASFQKGGKKPGFMASLKRRLSSIMPVIFTLIMMQLGLVFLTLVITVISQVFIDYIIIGRFPFWRLWFLGITGASMVLVLLLTYFQNIALLRAQIKLSTVFSANFFKHLFELPISFYEQRYSSEIAYRSSLNQQASSFLTGQLFDAVIQVLTIFIYGAALFFYSTPIAIATILCGMINLITVFLVHKRRLSIYSRYRQDIGKAAALSISSLEGFDTWKCLGIESRLFSWLSSLYTKSFNVLHELQNTDQILGNMSYLSQIISSGFLFIMGGWMLMQGQLTPGQFSALLLLVGLFIKPTTALVDINRNFELFQVDLARLDDVMDHPVDRKFTESGAGDRNQPLGDIEFKDVTYRYNINHPPILKAINLKVNKGKRVAIVGASGSGKSTLIKLLAGFITPEAGSVRIGNEDITTYSSKFLSQKMAFVFDTPFIFADTVKNNITMYDSTRTNAMIKEATHDACLEDRFNDWGMGEVLEEEGRNISGGEKQRVEISRSLVRNPEYLVLDEATSSLDMDTERRIMENLSNRKCGLLIATHRLTAVSLCDVVYVLQNGEIVQSGSPQELEKVDGPYKRMFYVEAAGAEK